MLRLERVFASLHTTCLLFDQVWFDRVRRLAKLKQFLRFTAGAAIVVCAYWNVVAFNQATESLAPRDGDEIVMREKRLAPVRQILLFNGYLSGEIAFITNRDFDRLPPLPEDDKRWSQSQYAMIPWVLVRNKRDTPFLLVDFWDGPPHQNLEALTKLYDGDGLVLFQVKKLP